MDIAEKIHELMNRKGITAYRLSKDTGVSYTGLTKILNGETKNPQIDSLKAIANYFGEQVDYFTGTDDLATPDWATAKDKRDLKRIIEEEAPLMFDGVPIEGENKQRIVDILTGLFWEAKEMNKKTYGRKKKTDDTNTE